MRLPITSQTTKNTSNFRFRIDIEDNPFQQSGGNYKLILLTFLTWESTEDVYYYNILKNKDKRSAKRKVTFE